MLNILSIHYIFFCRIFGGRSTEADEGITGEPAERRNPEGEVLCNHPQSGPSTSRQFRRVREDSR